MESHIEKDKEIVDEVAFIKPIKDGNEHKVDIIKAEQENMKHELAHISGDTKSIKSDMFKEKLS